MKSVSHFGKGAIKVSCGKVLKKNSIISSSVKLFIMQNYTNNANKWDMPLTVENV